MAKRIAKNTSKNTSKTANSKSRTRKLSAKESWAKCKTRVEAAKKVTEMGITLASKAAGNHLVTIMDARRAYARVYGTQLDKKERKALHKKPGQAKKIASAKALLARLCKTYNYSSVREAWNVAKANNLFEKRA